MKKLIVIFLTVSFIQVSGQSVEYSEVVKIDSTLTKDELFNRARSWFVDYYKNAKEVLQVSDKEAGELIGSANMEYNYYNTMLNTPLFNASIDYRISIHVKDGKYKVNVYQFINKETIQAGVTKIPGCGIITPECRGQDKMYNKLNEQRYSEMILELKKRAELIFVSINDYMNKPAAQKEDW